MAEKLGKLVYIEPNQFTVHGYDNIVNDVEDYSIGVDLQVEVINRDSCGQNIDGGTVHKLTWNPKNDQISFFKGTTTDGISGSSLTTEPMGQNFTEIQSGDNSIEGLGISSIDVNFSNWYYPVITIKFIDVRGITLMGPEDYSHTKDGDGSSGSFFKTFFKFPYPRFTLQVKGFYGKGVTFLLAISSFKTSFNSEQGCFEITTQFIGYMYGLLTDIPMKMIFAAPNDKYAGAAYWNSRNFTFSDGNKIPTFNELNRSVKTATLSKLPSSNTNVKKYSENEQQIRALETIMSSYQSFMNIGNAQIKKEYIDNNKFTHKFKNTIIFTSSNNILITAAVYNNLIDYIGEYNKQNFEHQIAYPNNLDSKILTHNYIIDTEVLFEFVDRKLELKKESGVYKEIVKEKDQELISYLNSLDGTSSGVQKLYNAYYFKDNGFMNKIMSVIQTLKIEQEILTAEVNTFETQSINTIIGFTPSIENIFKLTLAHLETFLNSMYLCMKKVKESGRKSSDLGFTSSNTDTKDNSFIAPFPLYTVNNVEEWVGNNPSPYNMEEVRFVENYLKGVVEGINDTEKGRKEAENTTPQTEINFLPLNTSDLIGGTNPYNSLYSENKNSLRFDEMLTHFALRCLNFLYLENKPKKELAEVIGEIEALNYFKVFPSATVDMISFLNGKKGEEFWRFLLSPYNGKNEFNYGVPKAIYTYPRSLYGILGTPINGFTWLHDKQGYFPINFKTIQEIPKSIEQVDKVNKMFFKSDDDGNHNSCVFDIYENKSYLGQIRNSIETVDNITDTTKEFINKKFDLDGYLKTYLRKNGVIINNEFPRQEEGFGDDIVKGLMGNEEINVKNENFTLNNRKEKFYYENNVVGRISNSYVDFQSNLDDFRARKENTNYNKYRFDDMEFMGKSFYLNDLFYLQNTKSIDEKRRNRNKALLFLNSTPFLSKIESLKEFLIGDSTNLKNIPKPLLLLLGGILWREKWCEDNNEHDSLVYSDGILNITPPPDKAFMYYLGDRGEFFSLYSIKLGFDIFALRKSLKTILIKYFDKWVDNGLDSFKRLNNLLEIKKRDFSYFEGHEFAYVKEYITTSYDNKGKLKTNAKPFKIGDVNKINMLSGFYKTVFSDNFIKNYSKFNAKHNLLCCRENTEINRYMVEFLFSSVCCVTYGKTRCNLVSKETLKDRNNLLVANKDLIISSLHKFAEHLLKRYGNKPTEGAPDSTTFVDSGGNGEKDLRESLKLSTYKLFKNLYDKWLCSIPFEKWKIDNNVDGLYNSFVFVDTFHNNIGSNLMINLDKLIESISSFNCEQSVYEFFASICQENNMLFMALPVYNDISDAEEIEEMFKPLPYNQMNHKSLNSTFVCMYTHEPSKHLNLDDGSGNNGYMNDGIDISDQNGKILPTLPSDLLREGDYSIPSFGVSFGSKDQSYFKSVDVNMDNPQVTEQSIANTLSIAKLGNQERQSIFVGQDLYKVYSNYSYTCSVNMMGCAQILPLMYFQLNNIPMFKGAYMISRVSHSIVPGNMTTTFSGYRINKNKIPFNTEILNKGVMLSAASTININDEINSEFIDMRLPDTDEGGPISNAYEGEFENFDVLKSLIEQGILIMDINEQNRDEYNNSTSVIKQLIVSIAKTIVERGYNYRLHITSMSRLSINMSDHNDLRSGVGTPSKFRKKIIDKGHKWVLEGCAFDMVGLEVGTNRNCSAQLFDLLLNSFTSCIRQLIWEDKESNTESYRDNVVSNVVHLASLGKDKISNGEPDIFQAYCVYVGKKVAKTETLTTRDLKTLQPLSLSFLDSVAKAISRKKITKANVISLSPLDNSVLEVLGSGSYKK